MLLATDAAMTVVVVAIGTVVGRPASTVVVVSVGPAAAAGLAADGTSDVGLMMKPSTAACLASIDPTEIAAARSAGVVSTGITP
ncbi:unannotated protein [freshwater metagenome]|uniref:Unannotated protein n=1 Tax=freshwater metagenome TaxID=449393 RepID=A0A6J7CIP7_9ZZZZ